MRLVLVTAVLLSVSGTAYAGKYTQAIAQRKAVGVGGYYSDGGGAIAQRKAVGVGGYYSDGGGAIAERKAVGPSTFSGAGGDAIAQRKAVGVWLYGSDAIAERKAVSETSATTSTSTVLDLNSGF